MDGAENFENSSEDCKIMKSENNEISVRYRVDCSQ
jgi:hypothetical protein